MMSDTASVGHIRLLVAGPRHADVETAVAQLKAVASGWGGGVRVTSAGENDLIDSARKLVDPVSLAALIISIPGALLAVNDLAERISKRRRAADLASNSPKPDTTARAYLIVDGQLLALDTVEPDQLLDLANQATNSNPH
jgi:hypothetical protein